MSEQQKEEFSKEARVAYNAYHRNWKAKNREKYNAYMREWRAKNQDKVRITRRKYWEKKATAEN